MRALLRVRGRELFEPGEDRVQPRLGGGVRLEVRVVAREQVPALAGLGVDKRRQDPFEAVEDDVRLLDLASARVEPVDGAERGDKVECKRPDDQDERGDEAGG